MVMQKEKNYGEAEARSGRISEDSSDVCSKNDHVSIANDNDNKSGICLDGIEADDLENTENINSDAE